MVHNTPSKNLMLWVLFAAWIIFMAVFLTATERFWTQIPLWSLLGSAGLYLASHLLRAVRLALLATPVLGLSGRSAALLHIVTAPASLLLPFKLGEILRYQQLYSLGVKAGFMPPLIVLVLDRVLDAVLIGLVFLLLLAIAPETAVFGNVIVLSLILIALAIMMFGFAPTALTALQRYVVTNHRAGLARRWLVVIDKLRIATRIGAQQIRDKAAALLVLSGAIWAAELAAMALVLWGWGANAHPAALNQSAAGLLLSRTASEWSVIYGLGHDPIVSLSAAIGLVTLAAIWPFALAVFLRRRVNEPMRQLLFEKPSATRVEHGI